MKYLLFWGCTIPRRLPFIEAASRYVLKTLGIEIEEPKEFACCPEASLQLSMDSEAYHALAARNLCIAQELGMPLLTVCNGCYYTLKNEVHALKDEEARSKINRTLLRVGMEYAGGVTVEHIANVLRKDVDSIRAKVERPLSDLRVAVHNGCHFTPIEDLKQLSDPAKVRVLDEVVDATGATSVEYPSKQACCGGNLKNIAEKTAHGLTLQKLIDVENAGCDCITTQCPFCYMHFDMMHRFIEDIYGRAPRIPVLSLVELVALSFGYTPKEIGIRYHVTPCDSLLEKLGF